MGAELFEKLANLIVQEVPSDQIAMVLGVSDAELVTLRESPEAKEAVAQLIANKIEDDQTLNDGWDSVEATALGIVVDNMKWNKDAKFALQVATLANKAQRKGAKANKPLQATSGVRAVIQLNMNFVKELQSGTQRTMQQVNTMEKKQTDSVNPKVLERMLNDSDTEILDIAEVEDNDILAGMQFAIAGAID